MWTWALAWVVAGVSWRADLLANLAAQGLLLTCALAVLWLLTRRRGLFILAVLACAMHGWVLSTGRAAWLPRTFEIAARAPGAVRFLHYNASHKRPPGEVFAMLGAASPDVASITEPNVPLQVELIYGTGLEDEYPYRLKRLFNERSPADRVGAGVVLSRWPLEPYPVGTIVSANLAEEFIAAVLSVPAAATGQTGETRWGLIAIHPRSPRNAARWAYGNELASACAAVAARMQTEGLPVVVLADLNATPTGWRSRELYFAAGLRRAKPLLATEGTYPAWIERGGRGPYPLAWPATIAIDDAFVSQGLDVRGWMRVDPAGSDHWPVLMELAPKP